MSHFPKAQGQLLLRIWLGIYLLTDSFRDFMELFRFDTNTERMPQKTTSFVVNFTGISSIIGLSNYRRAQHETLYMYVQKSVKLEVKHSYWKPEILP